MKIEHIRNAIDAQRGVMLETIEKQGVLLRFSVPTRHVKRERIVRFLKSVISFCATGLRFNTLGMGVNFHGSDHFEFNLRASVLIPQRCSKHVSGLF